MLFQSPLSLLFTTILLTSTTTTHAIPTRTRCHCTIIPNTTPQDTAQPPFSAHTPSAAHWTPQNPSPSPPARADFCSSLGDELESFPAAAEAFIAAHGNGLVPVGFSSRRREWASQQDSLHKKEEEEEEQGVGTGRGRGRSRLRERIVCRSAREDDEEFGGATTTTTMHRHYRQYQDSKCTLWALQIIIFIAVLACVVEAVQLGFRWYMGSSSSSSPSATPPSPRMALQFQDSEKVFLAVPLRHHQQQQHSSADAMYSPGVDKKLRSYEVMLVSSHASTPHDEKREAVAYAHLVEDDEDDELNRPVM